MIHFLKKNALCIQVLVFSMAMLFLPVQAQQNTIVNHDAAYVLGVNTAGTVRVNNLANPESLLNIIANASEITGFIFGSLLILRSLCVGRSPLSIPILKWKLGRRSQFVIGCALILIGLSIPGVINVINYLMVSNPDVNLFS